MQKSKNSTIDLHNIKQDIFLGFLSEESETPSNFEISFFGGEPIWLHQPTEQQQTCSQCEVNLTFLGQLYCPFDAAYCYHRVLYFLFCEKCIREFRCIRQQAQENFSSTQQIKSKVRKICEGKEVCNEPYSKNQLIKMMTRIKVQVEEEDAIEEADSEDEEDIAMNQLKVEIPEQMIREAEQDEPQLKQILEEAKKDEQQKDLTFQTYKKAIVQLENPCMLYTDTPLSYNQRPLNPQHFCKCGSKLSLEVQITQRILSMDTNPNSKLLLMDWGSLMVYTCGSSCQDNFQECVVVQYEIDAVTDQDIKKLNKKRKNKKKKDQKEKSKEKRKQLQKNNGNADQSSDESQDETQEKPKTETKNSEPKQAEPKQAEKTDGDDWD